MSTLVAGRLTVQGDVQGVGFRPAVARFARQLGLAGVVRNAVSGVQIHLEGDEAAINRFCRELPLNLPAQAHLKTCRWDACEPLGANGFKIAASSTSGRLGTPVPPDRATCESCLHEVAMHSDRRAGYAFLSCVDCGPRYSIIREMPYDRSRTTMEPFVLCSQCEEEYNDLTDRRCHAQTNACAACGPRLWLNGSTGQEQSIWEAVRTAIDSAKILALRGLGGYQLIVDATNSAAVGRLRERKRRPAKPLAVMVSSLSEAESLAELSEADRAMLSGHERPIVLVRAKQNSMLCDAIHPGLREIGLFLPTTALHWLLLDCVQRPLVVTSGNVDGAPLAVDPEQAEQELLDVADLWLHHDREIARPVDDSVVRFMAGQFVTLRSARGFAPLPLQPIIGTVTQSLSGTSSAAPTVLAVGGHQKVAVALCNGAQAILGPHIGDLDSLSMRQRYIQHVEQIQELYDTRPDLVVHDLHPDYFTTRWAQALECDTLAVQHHHAHIVSGMVENNWLDREVLGVAFDGTGYGTDGSIWGGEFLRTSLEGFERVAHLRSFSLPGGEAAIRQPWRTAASLLLEAASEERASCVLETIGISDTTVSAVIQLAESERLSSVTSSAGRLFDGVAALILGLTDAAYEGHPAMLLEAVADPSETGEYLFELLGTSPLQLDWRPAIRQLIADRQHGAAPETMAAKFHRGLASAIAEVCLRIALPVVLSGGVFQNRLLTELVVKKLKGCGVEVGTHRRIPPNDGGLAAGQLAIGIAHMGANSTSVRGRIEGGI
ncbi:MAG: carbamoyltransferase HypF [Planctomycetaceae bacterium]